MISVDYKCIFLHIPKCGGTTIETAFQAWKKPRMSFLGQRDGSSQHFRLKGILNDRPECKDYFKFTFVRNPFSRLVSIYNYSVQEIGKNQQWIKSNTPLNLSFKDFCLNLDFNLKNYCYRFHDTDLSFYIFDDNNKVTVDFIGKIENFQSDFDYVCDILNKPKSKLPHIFRSTINKHYTEYYDEDTYNIVFKKYKQDIEYFGYKFEN